MLLKNTRFVLGLILILGCPEGILAQSVANSARPRIIITADPELDDNNSLIRLLLYSTDVEIEGLIYASSQFHWKGDGKGTKWFVPGREYDRFKMNVCPCESWRWAKGERFIDDIVEAYGKVYPNLSKHHPKYPPPSFLKSKIRLGNIEFDGDISQDSPGSDLIKTLILDHKPGPLFITAWGGHSTIARALKSIQEQYQYTTEWETLKTKIGRKVVLLPSGDQDDTYATYIKPNWPEIEYRQFREGPDYGYGAQMRASAENAFYMTPAWMKENVLQRGPLGALYRVWGDGKQMVKGDKVDYFGLSGYSDEELKKMGYLVWLPVQAKGSWLGEGDNHTFMNLLGNGLRAFEKDAYGGWGGHIVATKEDHGLFSTSLGQNADEMAVSLGTQNTRSNQNKRSYPEFFPQAQRDFANRLKWSVTSNYADANHEPTVGIQGLLTIMAVAGQKVPLYATASDLDGNRLEVRWWHLATENSPEKVEIMQPNSLHTDVWVPKDAKPGQIIQLIFEATDDGTPALTRYQRVVVMIKK